MLFSEFIRCQVEKNLRVDLKEFSKIGQRT